MFYALYGMVFTNDFTWVLLRMIEFFFFLSQISKGVYHFTIYTL